jgi:hypothetical protein
MSSTIWRIDYAAGPLDFDDTQGEQLVIKKNRNQIIKQFGNRLHTIYTKGLTWRSFDLTFYDMTKLEAIRAITGTVNFYYDYLNNPTVYVSCMIDKNSQENYVSGYQDYNAPHTIKLIETVLIDPFVHITGTGMLLLEITL